jgi:CRISPR-associated protein (TIGR03986 family)
MTMPNKNLPEHQNPTRGHIASAPYNFVPLPEKIIPDVPDASRLPDHDRYYPEPDYHSGYFDVTLTTVSPLYIRGPIAANLLPRQEEVKDNPAFFHTGDEARPVIPGSSLRGMLRALLEIVSYSKMKWVSEKQLFFRTVDGTALGQYYNRRMVKDLGALYPARPRAHVYRALVEGGFFRVRENGSCFIEKCTVARVETLDLLWLFGLNPRQPHDLYEIDGRPVTTEDDKRDPNQTPNWSYQHREIWAAIDASEKDYPFVKQFNRNGRIRHPDLYLRMQRAHNLALTSEKGKKPGKLVLTGHMNYKHMAFLFVPFEHSPTHIEVPNNPAEQDPNKRRLDRFQDDDQLTPWQKKAFPANRQPAGPKNPGHLLDGDPVFFLRNEKGDLVFFGRAQMFRLPYALSPFKLVDPALHRATDIDYAEALFGFVRTRDELKELEKLEKDGKKIPQGDKRRAYAGRVIVTDAVLQSDPADIWLGEAFHPRILATPKPTAFQHYLTQQHPDEKKRLNHYDSKLSDSEETTIRGHKLYWHQGLGLGTDQNLTLEQIRAAIEEEPGKVPEDDTQHTRLKPLKPGVQFSFRVYFENLSDRELGALCWTLHPNGEPDRRYCHHLGMGKPLGMGAVELHARLHLINRPQRYEKLFNESGDSWQLGEDLADPEVLTRLTGRFEEHLLQELNPYPACQRLADMQRIAMLLKLLEWPGYPAVIKGDLYLEAEGRPNTRYMELGEYRDRPVLPDPTLFDAAYFENKSRPQDTPARQSQAHHPVAEFTRGDHQTQSPPARRSQVHKVEQPVRLDQQDGKSETLSQAATEQQAPAEQNGDLPVLPPEWARVIYIGNEVRGLSHFTRGEQGVEVSFWDWDPTRIIGFIPKGLVDRPLGQRISVIITGLRQEPNGRVVVELKLRSRRS